MTAAGLNRGRAAAAGPLPGTEDATGVSSICGRAGARTEVPETLGFAVGRVVALVDSGGYAERAVAPWEQVAPCRGRGPGGGRGTAGGGRAVFSGRVHGHHRARGEALLVHGGAGDRRARRSRWRGPWACGCCSPWAVRRRPGWWRSWAPPRWLPERTSWCQAPGNSPTAAGRT
ncbi:hypothetical protein QJS66_09700 [Kocuria rhizophila]|nr:hypothetical protein QJS66_09700 [Kocuria rhizophila]